MSHLGPGPESRAEHRLEDGVSLNQFIAAAVAEKVGTLRASEAFLAGRAGRAKPRDLLPYLRKAPKVPPAADDERPARSK